ncbi:MAG: L-fucose:H+ symporter permease [Bacteroidales bacterium]|nr:L-fucose:H+ symporter permease [Bacteroidales bacterium]MDD6732403.1 L-fucose:H+ symporter permease [Bacteroidales bacterium]MDY4557775.1 L-fucose:H+ symporter permease [Alloprevotella sp.]
MKTNRISLFQTAEGRNYLWPFVLVTSLFFLWGFAHSILDVLNKHFQDSMHISKTESALVQAVVYGGYFLMALPAGFIIRRFGYRAGVLTGLLLYGVGALLFIPGGQLLSFPFFLFSLFIIGCGLTCLETAANPYVTVLGRADGAERRINLAQSFNGLGWIVGPLVGGCFLFMGEEGSADISTPYAIIGLVVLAVACLFSRIKLPEVAGESSAPVETSNRNALGQLFRHRPFVWGMAALFLYVAAQTGINSFFINYVTENAGLSNATASLYLSFGGMGLFMLGRMGGSWLMARIAAGRVLLGCALFASIAMAVLLTGMGMAGIAAFFVCYLCESIMFPTIFALSLRGVGEHTKMASSLLIMCIVGGAIAPVLMGLIADCSSIAAAFVVPLACFLFIGAYALRVCRAQ